jgi:hypothetical protein
MGVVTYTMVTHERTELPYDAKKFNPCITCGIRPTLLRVVYGRKKYVSEVAYCKCEEGFFLESSNNEDYAVQRWNKYNTEK